MNIKHLILTVIIILGFGCTPKQRTNVNNGLSLEIVPHDYETGQLFINTNQNFYLLIKNNTGKDVKIWEDWCSYGYFAPSFDVKFKSGESIHITKNDTAWTRNFPDSFILKSSGSYVIAVNLESSFKESQKLLDNLSNVTEIKANYGIKSSDKQKKYNVWYGEISTDFQKAEFHRTLTENN